MDPNVDKKLEKPFKAYFKYIIRSEGKGANFFPTQEINFAHMIGRENTFFGKTNLK